MDITVSARHLDISTALRAAAEERIGRLSRFLGTTARAEVHFTEERNPRIAEKEICEVAIDARGRLVRCKAVAADPFAAVGLAAAKLEQQLHKAKTRDVLRTHQGPRRAPEAMGIEELDLDLGLA